MSEVEYVCSKCCEEYTRQEYYSLPREAVEDEEAIANGNKKAKKPVCRACGLKIRHKKWQRRRTIDTPDGEVDLSTVALIIPHGVNREQLYESCAFHEHGSTVVRRYKTEGEAYVGHAALLNALEEGNYTFAGKSAAEILYIDEDPP